MNSLKKQKNSTKGFTLIELLVSAGIFAVAITMTTGIFSRFIFTQRHDIAEQAMQEDVRLMLELFNREARTAYASTYRLADARGTSVSFRNQNGDCVLYRVSSKKQLERAQADVPGVECDRANFGDSSFAPLSSSRTVIDSLRFDVRLATVASNGLPQNQGFITVILKVSAKDKAATPLQIQGTVSSRQVTAYKAE